MKFPWTPRLTSDSQTFIHSRNNTRLAARNQKTDQLPGEQRHVLDDGETHAPLGVLRQLHDGGKQRLRQLLYPDHLTKTNNTCSVTCDVKTRGATVIKRRLGANEYDTFSRLEITTCMRICHGPRSRNQKAIHSSSEMALWMSDHNLQEQNLSWSCRPTAKGSV